MYMRKASSTLNCDPHAPIVITKEHAGFEPPSNAGKGVRFGFPVDKLFDSVARADQEDSSIVFNHGLRHASDWTEHRIKFRSTRLPSPQSGLCCGPDVSPAVLK